MVLQVVLYSQRFIGLILVFPNTHRDQAAIAIQHMQSVPMLVRVDGAALPHIALFEDPINTHCHLLDATYFVHHLLYAGATSVVLVVRPLARTTTCVDLEEPQLIIVAPLVVAITVLRDQVAVGIVGVRVGVATHREAQ